MKNNFTQLLVFVLFTFANSFLFAQNVGIGNALPIEKLDVSGGIRLGNTAATNAGTMRYTGTDFEGYVSGIWKSFTITGAGGSSFTDATLTGDGTLANPLGIAQQGATVGQVLTWNGTTWLPQTPSAGGLPVGTSAQTLRHDGIGWVASSLITNDGTNIKFNGDFLNQDMAGEYQTNLFSITTTPTTVATCSLTINDGPGPGGSSVLIVGDVKGRGINYTSNGFAGNYRGWQLVNCYLDRSINDPTFTTPTQLSQAYATSALVYGAGVNSSLTMYFTIPIVFYDNLAGVNPADVLYYRLTCHYSNNGVNNDGTTAVQHRSLVAVQLKR